MKLYWNLTICLVAAALGGAACGSPPPPEPPKLAPKPKPKPKPPPPPKCESLDEGCRAETETQAMIATSSYAFHPPDTWTYAQQARATVAQVDDTGPVLALTVFTPEDDKKVVEKQQTDALERLAEAVGITLPKKAVAFGRPEQKEEVAGLAMRYWQREKAERAEGAGSLLVLTAELEDRTLLGLGYVPDDDKSEADRHIFEALQSIKKKGDDGEGKADESATNDDGS